MRTKRFAITKSWLLYILLYIGIFSLQTLYTLQTTHFITHEELAESIRNVWWLQNHGIYDGISSNVGWYTTVQLWYNLFGFSLFMGKAIRLALFAIGLFCSFDLLLKYLGKKLAWLPLVLFGLSPTLLYFTTLQTSFGIDVPYFIIVIWLFLKSLVSQKPLFAIVLGFVLSLAALSYPSFLLYLPSLAVISIVGIRKKKLPAKRLALIVLGAILPVVFILLYLNEPNKLLFDHNVNSGIFRGGGTFPNTMAELLINIQGGLGVLFQDLFIAPGSYYFDAARSEFSHFATRLSVYAIMLLVIQQVTFLVLRKKFQEIIIPGLALFSLLLGGTLASISNWFPGLRRATIILVVFYILVAWLFKLLRDKKLGHISSLTLFAATFLILAHHIRIIPASFAKLSQANTNTEVSCFAISGGTPSESLIHLQSSFQATSKLDLSFIENSDKCRLAEVYAAIASDCFWNNRVCPPILWQDEKSATTLQLETKLWDEYYFSH
ncbi:MAG: hypothetical protein GW947_02545 [Candidatus Pacebacteria bacterium]|nr:hypothetical protein [Candidatus Paceibacterota bacterium]PIR61298.1 MAG: hypothetical protein COU68_00190 [Candidatus Pacebacteria bacterium CG10_big_fil_rev_8_21_14_0_10_45_6]